MAQLCPGTSVSGDHVDAGGDDDFDGDNVDVDGDDDSNLSGVVGC